MDRVVVIGGGFGGLATGALLSKKGKKILLIEERERLGGRAHYIEKEGFVFQYGQHSHRLGPDGYANEVMKRIDRSMTFYKINPKKAKLFYRGRLYARPAGPLGFLTTQALGLKSRLTFLRLYKAILQAEACDWYDKSLLDFYRTFFKPNAEVEGFLNFLGFTIMLPDASLVSAGEVIDFIKRVSKAKIPVADVAGGSKQIIDRLSETIIAHGGEIHLSEKAVRLSVKNRKIEAVYTLNGVHRPDAVVFAAPVTGLKTLLEEAFFPPATLSYMNTLKHSSGVVIDFISHTPLSDLEGGILGVDEPLWVKFQTLFDSTVAPPGHHVCTFGLLAEWGKGDDPAVIKKTETRLREIAEICMPGYRKKIVDERKLVIPVVNATMLTPSQSRPFRPEIRFHGIENLYLAGDTVAAPGCSGDIAFASALMIADMID
jgi:phytoene dehydrogenase-like protein